MAWMYVLACFSRDILRVPLFFLGYHSKVYIGFSHVREADTTLWNDIQEKIKGTRRISRKTCPNVHPRHFCDIPLKVRWMT